MDDMPPFRELFAKPRTYLVSCSLSRGVYTGVSGALLLVLQGQFSVKNLLCLLHVLSNLKQFSLTSKGIFGANKALSGLQQTKDCKSEVFKAKVQGISRSAEAGIQQL